LIVILLGIKHSFVVSHPGTDVPWGMSTEEVSANALGILNVMAITKNTISGNTFMFCIFIDPNFSAQIKDLS